jgi:hypothetical protein
LPCPSFDGGLFGSSACADSAKAVRIDTNGRTIRERLDLLMFTPSPLPCDDSKRQIGSAPPQIALILAAGNIADEVRAFCLVTNQ